MNIRLDSVLPPELAASRAAAMAMGTITPVLAGSAGDIGWPVAGVQTHQFAGPSLNYAQFMRFAEVLLGASCLSTYVDAQFWSDDKVALAKANERQLQRRKDDPSFRQGRKPTFDPNSRGPKRSRMTPDEVWMHACLANRAPTAAAIGIRVNESDGQGALDFNFVRPRAIFVDCDSAKARGKFIAFIRRTELVPTMAIQSSTGEKAHFYFVLSESSRASTSWEDWSAMQEAIAAECGSDASLSDRGQVMRWPGTLNFKDPQNPLPVKLLFSDGPLWDFADLVKRSGLKLKPKAKSKSKARDPTLRGAVSGEPAQLSSKMAAAMKARFAAGKMLNGNFIENVSDGIDVRAAADVCPALEETFRTAGASHNQSLWFAMLGFAVFDADPLACAVAMSSGYPGNTLADTQAMLQRKLDDKQARDMGYPKCQFIAQQHPACRTCFYRNSTTSALSIHNLTRRTS
ncbi:hypothetical protein [Rhizobium sp. RAF56]|uniref:hypothetical protein n=1 Tax=Rhizobium sp. RAF56 TaxID=3233062 RepID=UPI003F989D8C